MQFLKKNAPFIFILLALVTFLAYDYWFYAHDYHFHPNNLHSALPSHPSFTSISLRQEERNRIFNQRFHYLGRGKQCFAFESDDGRYVIKFLKKRHLKQQWFKDRFKSRLVIQKYHPEAWRDWLIDMALRYQMAWETIPEETGLIMLHFQKTADIQKKITLISPLKKTYEIDLDNAPFILQEKAELASQRIKRLLKKKNREGAIQSILELHKLLVKRTEKGLTDEKQCYQINFGFGAHGALQIDVGKIVNMPLAVSQEEETERLTNNLKEWVRSNFVSLYSEIEKRL